MVRQKRRIGFSLLQTAQRLPWRYPWLTVILVVLLLMWYAHEVFVARPAMAWMGLPRGERVQPAYWTHVLRNEGFLVGYSELRANPLWVIYRLTANGHRMPGYKRPGRFEADWRSLAHIGHDDFSHSGYTRGHLAPNHAIARLYGREAQLETFLMTNISPQRADLNTRVWERLEKWELEEFAQHYGNVWVTTGPIFDDDIQRLATSIQVEIPDAFYKILAVPAEANNGTPLLRAFIVSQNSNVTADLENFATSVDRVEELTGFDFFSELPDELEDRLESVGKVE